MTIAEPPGRGPFVGRTAELGLLLDSVARVRAVGTVAVLVDGEPGIGKSRLLAEAAGQLSERGWRVLPVRADRLERQVPYGALGTAVRALDPDNSFTQELRRELLGELDLPSGTAETPPGAAFGRACMAATRLVTALGTAGPLAIFVDDLHELDDDSLALLSVVARRAAAAPVALVAASRPDLAAPNLAAEELVERLADSVELVRVELGTLAPAELATMVTPILGAPPDDALAAELYQRADGNPFFAAEIARSLVDSGLVDLDGDKARLSVAPQTVHLTRRAAILRRVVPLAPDALAVARTLAVLRSADLARIELVADVAGLPRPAVAAAFDDLLRARVVVPDAAGRYRFFHDIVADALYDDIGPAQCRGLHRAVADRMLAQRTRGEAVDLLELAWHVSESAQPRDRVAVEVLSEAAHRALSSAPEAAAGFCTRALALLGADAPQRAVLLALQCRALARASRPADAVPPGRAALALLPPGAERARTATAVIGCLFLLGRIAEAIEVADEQTGTGDAPAALHAQRALLLVFANRTEEALAEADAATAVPPASPAEEVVVYTQLAMVSTMLFRHEQTVALADRALAASGTSTTLRLQALAMCAFSGCLAGLVADATHRLRLAEQIAEETGNRHLFRAELDVTRVVLDWLGGRWDTALEGIRALAAELTVRQQVFLAAGLAAIELEVRTWRGELVLAERLAQRPVPPARNMASLHAWARAGFLAARGDDDAARAILCDAGEHVASTYIALLLSRLVEVELEHGGRAEARTVLERLVEVAKPHVSPWSRTTVDRVAGLVERDPAVLARAVAEAEEAGLVFERARAQLALGELDPSAEPALVEAYRTFARLGAHGLRRRAGRRLHELGAKVPRTRSRTAGLLTESEERVARLVQQGMRNREIAAALHYSPRSIEVYLSRIYAKLRVSSRLELARALDAMDAGS